MTYTLLQQNLGQYMRLMVQKAIQIIQDESHNMIVEEKIGYTGLLDDCVTSGDKKAQKMYVEEIQTHFPTFGIIAEEKDLVIPCTEPGHTIYFTIDPLDGTKAYRRKQSHGVGTMIALVYDGEIIAAYIGDINTGEIYGFDPIHGQGADIIRHRFGKESHLEPNLQEPLTKQYLLTRDNPWDLPPLIQHMIFRKKNNTLLFKSIELGSGSIGTHIARLWKGEVGAAVLNPGADTPWDNTPVVGITLKLGFRFFKLYPGADQFIEYTPPLFTEKTDKPFTEFIVHTKHVPELMKWLKTINKHN